MPASPSNAAGSLPNGDQIPKMARASETRFDSMSSSRGRHDARRIQRPGALMRQTRTFLFALFPLFLACGTSTASRAQGYDEACMQAVEELCGKTPVMQCFANDAQWGKIPERCHGDVQSMFEAENDSAAADGADPAEDPAATPIEDLSALSYGGILRAGPGMDSKKKASIRLGQPIELIEATGIWTDDFQWFKVRTASGTGYHWGGIFCTMGGAKPEGVLYDCDENPPGSF